MKNIKKGLIKILFILTVIVYSIQLSAQDDGFQEDKKTFDYVLPGTSTKTSRKLATSAIADVTGDEISIPSPNINNMLFGRIAGLNVAQATGEPGYDAAGLNIRGVASYYSTDFPVFVDGFQTNMSFFRFMSPGEIENITVLKDAASLAPFGMRGANGVLWVTTKRGMIGKPQVTLQARAGLQQSINVNKPLNTYYYSHLYNEALSNDEGQWINYYTETEINNAPDIDWYDEVARRSTPYQDYEISVKGGAKEAKYSIFAGYMDQRGIYDVAMTDTTSNAGIKRYNLRANLDLDLFNFFEAKIDLGGRIEDRRYPNCASGDLWNYIAKHPSNIYPVKNEDGTWTGTPIYNHNPVAEIRATGLNSTHDRTLQINVLLKERLDFITNGLYLSQAVSLSNWTRDGAGNTRNYARYLNGVQQTTDQNTPYSRYENSGSGQWNWQQYSGTLGYDKELGRHNISASANILYSTYNTDQSSNGDAGMMIDYKYANVSGLINYSYHERYVIGLGFSASASDNYKPGNRWGVYPTVSAAWIVSNENFLEKSDIFDFIKIRASIGKTGLDPMRVRRYLWETYYNYTGGLNLGNGVPQWNSGLALRYVPNEDIFAETSWKYDAGIDLSFWNKLSLNLDLFIDKRSDIVTRDYMIPSTVGTEPPYRNVGKVTNKGFEAVLGYRNIIGDFSYRLTGMVSHNNNKVDYMAEVVTVPTISYTGKELGVLMGYVAEGFYDITDFDSNGNLNDEIPMPTFGPVQPGDVKYKDISGDDVIDENDQSKIGNSSRPKWVYSLGINLGYKGFDFCALFQGVGGREINLLSAPLQVIAFRDNGNVYPIATERWAYYPERGLDTRQTASYPRLSTEDNSNNYRNSTIWVKNGDYFRLRNIEIGYTFTQLKKNKISELRLYLSGINLFTFSKLMKDYDMDPEVISGHQAMKSYNIGITVNF